MNGERGTLRMMATSLLVAYALVLQALLGGLASGTHTGSAFARDAFGAVLCVSTDHGRPTNPGPHTPDCCSTACQLPFGSAAPPATAVALVRPLAAPAGVMFATSERTARPAIPPGPNRARAPPLA